MHPAPTRASRRLALLLSASAALPLSMAATEALQQVSAFDAGHFYDQAGFGFRPVSHLTVTALGYNFRGGSSHAAYTVELFDASWTLLAAAALSVTGAPTAEFVYTNVTPLGLSAGSTNFLVCHDTARFAGEGIRFWAGNYVFVGNTGSFDVAPEIGYLGATMGTGLYGGTNAPLLLWVGPNFQFIAQSAVVPVSLAISVTASNTVRIRWSAEDALGQLQTGADLGLGMTNVLIPPVLEGTNKVVELPVTEAQAFFRLFYFGL